jgi:hypothetical protein
MVDGSELPMVSGRRPGHDGVHLDEVMTTVATAQLILSLVEVEARPEVAQASVTFGSRCCARSAANYNEIELW